jgi:CheY-like chemotaxis protein
LQHRKAVLEPYGFCIETAVSGYAAIKKLQERLVTTVLLEYKREGMDTEAVAFHIKQRFPHVPIILLSAYFQMPERILWLVDEYVLKSELPNRLVHALKRVMGAANNDQAHSRAVRSKQRLAA